jgi:replicative DNA helicase
MNAAANDDTFKTENLPSPSEAFGSSMNEDLSPDDDNEVPF